MHLVDINRSEEIVVKHLLKYRFENGVLFENGVEMKRSSGYIGFSEDSIFYSCVAPNDDCDVLMLPENFTFALNLVDEIIYNKK